MIAISLLWHWSLISEYVAGYDIHHEIYYQNLVLTNSVWDYNFFSNVNSMLSVTMLGPAYSLLLNVDIVWILKIIYPLFFSLLPMTLFQIYRKQTGDRVAFYAVFFFMSFSFFFSEAPQLARQETAELFFALLVLSLLDRTMAPTRRALLLIIWGFSITVSHYGLSYFVLFYLALSAILLSLMRNRTLRELWQHLKTRFSQGRRGTEIDPPLLNHPWTVLNTSPLTMTYLAIFITFALAWYMYVGSGSPLNSIVNIGRHTYQTLSDFFIPEAREPAVLMAVGLASPEIISIQRNIYLVVQYLTQFFIVVGVIKLISNPQKTRFQPLFVALTLISSLLLLLCIVLPYFSRYFNISRIYHITLLFLAPFCVLGGIAVFRWLVKAVRPRFSRFANEPVFLRMVVILIMVPYFLFSTAFIYAVTGDTVNSITLNPRFDFPRYSKQDVYSKDWLLLNKETGSPVYADWYGEKWLVGDPRWGPLIFFGNSEYVRDNAYLFLRSLNVKRGEVKESPEEFRKYVNLQNSPFGEKVLARRSKIYTNGGAEVYH